MEVFFDSGDPWWGYRVRFCGQGKLLDSRAGVESTRIWRGQLVKFFSTEKKVTATLLFSGEVSSFHFGIYPCRIVPFLPMFLEDNTTTKLFYELPKVQLLLMQFRNFSAQGCHGCKSQSFSQRDFPIRLEFIEFQILQVPCIFLAKLTGIDTLWVCSFFNQINT